MFFKSIKSLNCLHPKSLTNTPVVFPSTKHSCYLQQRLPKNLHTRNSGTQYFSIDRANDLKTFFLSFARALWLGLCFLCERYYNQNKTLLSCVSIKLVNCFASSDPSKQFTYKRYIVFICYHWNRSWVDEMERKFRFSL